MKKFSLFILLATVSLCMSAQPPQPRGGHGGRPGNERMVQHDPHQGRDNHQGRRDDGPMCPVASPQQVNDIMAYLNGVTMSSDKLKAAKLCVSLCPILTDDLGRIAKTFSFDEERLEFLKAAYKNCPDPQRYPRLKSVFTFSSNYEALMLYISR